MACALAFSSPLVAQAFTLVDSSPKQFASTQVYGWYVQISRDSGSLSLTAAGTKALYFHNAMSTEAFARSQSADIRLRYIKDEFPGGFVGLAGQTPNSYSAAQHMTRKLAISPQANQALIEPSVLAYALTTTTPTDQCYVNQPYLANDDQYVNAIEADMAWSQQSSSNQVVIAVLDTGVVQHTDFGDRELYGKDYVSNAILASDGDGRDDDANDPGFSSNCVSSSGYHGTHVASIAAGVGNNGLGIAGISWKSTLLNLRVIGVPSGAAGDILAAARDLPSFNPTLSQQIDGARIRIANMSLGLDIPLQCSQAFIAADFATTLLNNDILPVVAAGNSHADAGDYAPSNCPDTLSVAAINHQGAKTFYSNYGPQVDIAAPGGEFGFGNSSDDVNQSYGIVALVNNNRYEYKQGTSMATPMVAGVASLLMGYDQDVSAREVRNILMGTASPFSANASFGLPCDTQICGTGVVNAKAALEHLIDGQRYIFFPRQDKYIDRDATDAGLKVLLTRKAPGDISFRIEASSGSCTPATKDFSDLKIPAGGLEYNLPLTHTPGCSSISYELFIHDKNNLPLNDSSSDSSQTIDKPVALALNSNDKRHKATVHYLGSSSSQPSIALNRVQWSYLDARQSAGNTHTMYIPHPGNYLISSISDLDTELIIRTNNGDDLYSTESADSANTNSRDSFIHFHLDRAQNLNIIVKERFPGADDEGGIYAMAMTKAPSFSTWEGYSENYCQVELGVDSSNCASPGGTSDSGNFLPSNSSQRGSASLSLAFLLLLGLIASYAAFARGRIYTQAKQQ